MEIKTFDTVLTEICDFFDSLISPRTITRTNTNVIYLVLKGVAKGFEVINNVCVALSNKFDPASCSEDDLESVAFLVGTKKIGGAKSGLSITATNGAEAALTVEAGTYTYSLDADTRFIFEIVSPVTIQAGANTTFIALSENKGSFPVTQQSEIAVSGDGVSVPSGLVFSCSDNKSLLGYADETNLEFRKRIITQTDRQDAIKELETKIKSLPYVFDCKIKFNNSAISIPVGSYEIPPYNMLIVISAAMLKNEIAEIVASSAIYPTAQTVDSEELVYSNPAFANGEYKVYVNRFADSAYNLNITYKLNNEYVGDHEAQLKIKAGLLSILNTNIHKDIITADEIFRAIDSINVEGFTCLSVSFKKNDLTTNYLTFNETEIARLVDVAYNPVI